MKASLNYGDLSIYFMKAAIFIMTLLVIGLLIGYYVFASKVTVSPKVPVITASLYAELFKDASVEANIPVAITAMGSVEAARQVLLNPGYYGIYASIDPYVLTSILYPNHDASWYIAIAGDEMVIAYSPKLPEPLMGKVKNLTAEETAALETGNYQLAVNLTVKFLNLMFSNYTISLARRYGAYVIGTSNPNTDPEGYRALMVLQLAGIASGIGVDYYVNLLNELNSTREVYEVLAGSELLGPLQLGKVLFDIAIYKSSAEAANLSYFPLPPMINLGDPNYSNLYSEASVTIIINGKPLIIKGAPIQLAVTVPSQYRHKGEAVKLILFLISHSGHELMRRLGIVPIKPAIIYGNLTQVPAQLRLLVNSSEVVYGG